MERNIKNLAALLRLGWSESINYENYSLIKTVRTRHKPEVIVSSLIEETIAFDVQVQLKTIMTYGSFYAFLALSLFSHKICIIL